MSMPFPRHRVLTLVFLPWAGLICVGGCDTSAPVAGKQGILAAESPVQVELPWPRQQPDGTLEVDLIEVKGGLPPIILGDNVIRPKTSTVAPLHMIGGRLYAGVAMICRQEPSSAGESALPGHFCVVLCRPIDDAGLELELIVHTSVPVTVSLPGITSAQIISKNKWEVSPLAPPHTTSLDAVSLPHLFAPGNYEIRAHKE